MHSIIYKIYTIHSHVQYIQYEWQSMNPHFTCTCTLTHANYTCSTSNLHVSISLPTPVLTTPTALGPLPSEVIANT